ncbi:MAG: NAD-dependent protein deacylase [Bdellovibrionales bacterium]|nr:NAD-dependent protein deacylase [Bdellovibrionales bacterium]
MSADSGLKTFRDSDGLWEGYDVHEVATPEAWRYNPELVLKFYNERRAQVRAAEPNAGHFALAELESAFDVEIVTQNIDDLHERAGSTRVLHLHGEVLKSRTQQDPKTLYEVSGDINLGDSDERGNQLRPHVVWFGEAVTEIENAVPKIADADILLIVGTSLVVYPAAGLVSFARPSCRIILVDPNSGAEQAVGLRKVEFIRKPAAQGVPELARRLLGSE